MKNHKRPRNASAKSGRAPSRQQNHGNPGRLQLPQGERLFGQHAVRAALANPARDILALYVTQQAAEDLPELHRPLRPTLVDRHQLDVMTDGAVHQGVVCIAKPLPELDLEDVIRAAGENDIIVLLDQVTDPHNVGAILRSAAVFGASAVVMTDRHAPGQMGTLAKSASGALERVALVRVVNLARAIEQLQQADYWCVGLAEEGAEMPKPPLPPKVALVMGAEGEGLRRLTRERCDALFALPGAGEFTTLNVSNAAAVALYHLFANKG
ncbi:MAG: 23S rRNA (guanosine(2251)-2'-O)-methyltransferase RlmB [Bdellovibrionales bacterium]